MGTDAIQCGTLARHSRMRLDPLGTERWTYLRQSCEFVMCFAKDFTQIRNQTGNETPQAVAGHGSSEENTNAFDRDRILAHRVSN